MPALVSGSGWLVSAAAKFFFPHYCKCCGGRALLPENPLFCPVCWDASPRVLRPFCVKCGRPHPGMVGFGAPSNITCTECRDHPNPQVDRIFAAALYDGAVKEAVRLFKFSGRLRLQQPLGDLVSVFAYAEMEQERYDCIVPVPLHRVRQRARGFNQSMLLAEEIAPCFPDARIDGALRRIRPTQAQSKLKGEARERNVRGAFAVEGEAYAGARVLLVDDVVTTAGTVTECARALRRAGAVHVDVLAVAVAAVPGWKE